MSAAGSSQRKAMEPMGDRPTAPSKQDRQLWPIGLIRYVQYLEGKEATPPDIREAAAALWGCTEPGARTQIYDACERARCKAYKFNAVLTELIGK